MTEFESQQSTAAYPMDFMMRLASSARLFEVSETITIALSATWFISLDIDVEIASSVRAVSEQ